MGEKKICQNKITCESKHGTLRGQALIRLFFFFLLFIISTIFWTLLSWSCPLKPILQLLHVRLSGKSDRIIALVLCVCFDLLHVVSKQSPPCTSAKSSDVPPHLNTIFSRLWTWLFQVVDCCWWIPETRLKSLNPYFSPKWETTFENHPPRGFNSQTWLWPEEHSEDVLWMTQKDTQRY